LLSNEGLKGKVLFINFWFAACPPCIAEFDALSEMYEKLKDKPDFEFISLTYESQEIIEKVKTKYQLKFPVYSISKEECQRLSFGGGYPTNIIVDKNGRIQYLYVGGETSRQGAKLTTEKEIYSRILKQL
jgi:thiol-disulfide isomerase/thioredoxin